MYNEQEIYNKCKEFTLQHFNMEFDEKVRISKKMTRAFAKVIASQYSEIGIKTYVIKELVFAHRIFQNPIYDNKTLDSIILHELVHYYFFKMNRNVGHNFEFKELCKRVGGDLGYSSSEITEYGTKKMYVVVCSKCLSYTCSRTYKPSEKLLSEYLSKCCLAKMKSIGQREISLENVEESLKKIIKEYKAEKGVE